MESCEYLKDYATFVGKAKDYKREYDDLSSAIDKAIKYCMRQNIMKDILEKHRLEVARLIFKEFDETEFLKQQQKEAEDLKEEIRLAREETKLANERAEQSEKPIKLANKETERLREILEATWLVGVNFNKIGQQKECCINKF